MTRESNKVFVSYSWDSEKHKSKVEQFIDKLRNDGIIVISDRDMLGGDYITQFMEKAIKESYYVIFICTPTYKQKSDERQGGVGYENMVITAEIYEGQNPRKFIPVLFSGEWNEALPHWARGKLGIDLRTELGNNYIKLLKQLSGDYENNNRKTMSIINGFNFSEKETKITYDIHASASGAGMYNLFVTSEAEAWESESYVMPRERCLTSYTPENIKVQYGKIDEGVIEKVLSYPCIFAYEDLCKKDAYIGTINNLIVRDRGVKVYYSIQHVVQYDVLRKLAFELDLNMRGGITELMHTHWTIKEVNLMEYFDELIKNRR